ncbi:GGDEF and EAL domain-containing protein (plasmid) [Pseudorhodobacter turbinis]|uniref:GGDEF and EAL domain-containing protein n=1 Tax=Pseudorhodobacter turbinis TaxID=2500533 RepID=A0A4V1E191_9RHOB|nr:GGDEF and EAL domain-containing protein [Pseudorhodobacter turbinis]QCO57314.1 GGDEF and EAL domain-containing protein [Pseudorhodobacter turbinis]
MIFASLIGRLSDRFTSHLIARRMRVAGVVNVNETDIGAIRQAQIRAVLSISTIMMAANIVNSSALLLIEVELGSLHFSTLMWAAIIFFFAAQNFRAARHFLRAPLRPTSSERGTGKIVITSVLLALFWCYPMLALLDEASLVEFAFISTMTAGMIAGGALSLYPVPLAAVSYTGILLAAALYAVLGGVTGHILPFMTIIIAFAVIILMAIHRHNGIFFLELAARIEAERQRDMTNLLLDTYHGEGGQYLWRATTNFDLITDAAPLLQMIGLKASVGQKTNLFDLLEIAGFSLPAADDGVQVPTADTLADLGGTGITIRKDGRVLKVAARQFGGSQLQASGYLGYVKDITAETLAAEERERLAMLDSWTDLLNYREFSKRGERMISRAAPGAYNLYLFIDADDLKTVNDQHGHAAGDQLILTISRQLTKTLPENALIARKGGDEFLALMQCRDAVHGETIVLELLRVLRSSFQFGKSDIAYSCCIGASISHSGQSGLAQMELEADRALYNAKSTGKRRARFYDAKIGAEIGRNRRLAMDLLTAIETNSLDVHYQPINGGPADAVLGAEALLRWTHPEFGAIPPLEILTLAREIGVSDQINELVLRKAAAVAANWPKDTFISVNLNASDLKTHGLADSILTLIRNQGLTPDRLWLEVTEAEALVDCEKVRANIVRLRAEGIVMAIDDFGTGYSSFSTFDQHDFDVIKIDRSLVAQSRTSVNSRIFLRSIHDLASANGCRVVAEGIETAEEMDAIRTIGFEFTQGFLFSRPMKASQITRLFTHDCSLQVSSDKPRPQIL